MWVYLHQPVSNTPTYCCSWYPHSQGKGLSGPWTRQFEVWSLCTFQGGSKSESCPPEEARFPALYRVLWTGNPRSPALPQGQLRVLGSSWSCLKLLAQQCLMPIAVTTAARGSSWQQQVQLKP